MNEADHERRWLTDEDDADSPIVIAVVDGRVVGTIRITWGGAAPFRDSNRKAYDTCVGGPGRRSISSRFWSGSPKTSASRARSSRVPSPTGAR